MLALLACLGLGLASLVSFAAEAAFSVAEALYLDRTYGRSACKICDGQAHSATRRGFRRSGTPSCLSGFREIDLRMHMRHRALNEHLDEEDGPLAFAHACKMGLEGIVSKRRDSRYVSGRSPHWIKSKNPNAPAAKRDAEED